MGDVHAATEHLLRLGALAGATTATAGMGTCGVSPEFAAVGVLIWAGLGGWRLGPGALLTGLPALGLLAGPWAVAGWGAAGGAAAIGAHLYGVERLRRQTSDLRRQVHQAERDHQQVREIIARYPALQAACLAISAVRDMDHLAKELCRQVLILVPSTRRVRIHVGVASQLACRASADDHGGICPRDPADDERYVASEARILTRREDDDLRVLVPLRGERRSEHSAEALCGVLDVTIPPHAEHEHLRLELLRTLAQLGGIGLAAVDLVNQARSLALRDDLTGLLGQHEFLRRLAEQVATARRNDRGLGVVMCDLDHLKRFNDNYGHAAGDQALKVIASTLAQISAEVPGAIACRYGGEEFALCLPDLTGEALRTVAEQVRTQIATAIPDPAHPQRRVTASLGIASLRPSENSKAVMIRADAACYRAKDAGRNRVADADDLGSVDVATRIIPAVTRERSRA
jgi:diguanylate cyclase (GGDEF)-like protein